MQGRSTCSCCKLCSSKLFTVVAVALCKTTRMRHQTSSVHTQPAHTTTHIYTHCLKLKQTEASVQQAPEETILPPDLLAPKAVIQMLQNYAQMLQNYTQMLQNYTQMLQNYTQMLHRITLKCFRITLKCFRITLKYFRLTLKCFRITLKCFRITLKCFRLTLKCFKLIARSIASHVCVRDLCLQLFN